MPTAAIVIGTLSPDFEYLARLAPRGQFAHSLAGILLFCVPVSLAVWALFESVVRPALASLLPTAVGDLLAHGRGSVPRSRLHGLFLAALAALLGALSHMAWDSFTHQGGWVVTQLPVLAETAGVPGLGEVKWYTLLQHGSTLAGSVVVTWWLARAVTRVPPHARSFAPGQSPQSLRALVTVLCVSMIGGILNGLRAPGTGLPALLGYAAVGAMLGLAVSTLVVALAIRASTIRRSPDNGS